MEFRGPDEDGGDAITVALFSYKTAERLSKKQLHEEIVRKARYLLKGLQLLRKGASSPHDVVKYSWVTTQRDSSSLLRDSNKSPLARSLARFSM